MMNQDFHTVGEAVDVQQTPHIRTSVTCSCQNQVLGNSRYKRAESKVAAKDASFESCAGS